MVICTMSPAIILTIVFIMQEQEYIHFLNPYFLEQENTLT